MSIISKNLVFDRYCASIVASAGIVNTKGTAGRKGKKCCNQHRKILCTAPGIDKCHCLPVIGSTIFGPLEKGVERGCAACDYANFTKKGPRTLKKLTQLINLFYETREKQGSSFYWVTITTVQHKTLLTDQDILYKFKLWRQHRRERYICVTERQRNTGDLHLHIIIERTKLFNFKAEVERLAGLLSTVAHPALFDAKHIRNVQSLVSYIGKYVRKPVPKRDVLDRMYARKDEISPITGKPFGYKPPYSSLFWCRTFSCSGDLGDSYREKHTHFRLAVSNEFIVAYKDRLKLKYKTDYFTVYEWDVKLWNEAHKWFRRSVGAKKPEDPSGHISCHEQLKAVVPLIEAGSHIVEILV